MSAATRTRSAPVVFRGVGPRGNAARLLPGSIAYLGLLGILVTLGLEVRGLLGWALVLAPLSAYVGARLVIASRVAVEVDDERLRYEGSLPRDDVEVAVASIERARLEHGALVLTLADDTEHPLRELSPAASSALRAHLDALGVDVTPP